MGLISIKRIDANIFPNPFHEELNIHLIMDLPGDQFKIRLRDSYGRVRGYYEFPRGTNEWKIPETGLAPGVYLIDLISGEFEGAKPWKVLKF